MNEKTVLIKGRALVLYIREREQGRGRKVKESPGRTMKIQSSIAIIIAYG